MASWPVTFFIKLNFLRLLYHALWLVAKSNRPQSHVPRASWNCLYDSTTVFFLRCTKILSCCWLVRVSLLIKVPARTPGDLWFTNLCKFWPIEEKCVKYWHRSTFQPIQIKYVKWNDNTNDVICETATLRQFDAISSFSMQQLMFTISSSFFSFAMFWASQPEYYGVNGACKDAVFTSHFTDITQALCKHVWSMMGVIITPHLHLSRMRLIYIGCTVLIPNTDEIKKVYTWKKRE